MFLYAIEFELLETLHLPLVMLAHQRVAEALAPVRTPLGDVALLTGEPAAVALTQALPALHARPGNVFHTAGMVAAMCEAAQAANEPVVVAQLRHGTAATLWPLRIVRRRGVTCAVDLTGPLSQYADTLGARVAADDIAGCATALKAHYGVDAIQMRRVRADSPLASALMSAGAQQHTAQAAPFIDLAAFRDLAHYESQVSRHTRRNRRQRRQKLEAAHGPLTFAVVPAREHRDMLRTAIGWKQTWLAQHGCASAVFDGGAYEQALLSACDDANAHLSVLCAGDTLAAVELGFSCGEFYAAYLGSYNPALASFSVGQEQMLRTLGWCFTRGFTRYDLLAPADSYKRGWAHGNAVAVHDYALPLSLLGKSYVAAQRCGRAALQRTFYALPLTWRQRALHWRGRFMRR